MYPLISYKSYFRATFVKFSDLLGGWNLAADAKFHLNISNIIPDRPKNRNMGCEYH